MSQLISSDFPSTLLCEANTAASIFLRSWMRMPSNATVSTIIEMTPKSWTVAIRPTRRCFSAGVSLELASLRDLSHTSA